MKKLIISLSFLMVSFGCFAKPNYDTVFDINLEQLTRAKIINKSGKDLACYIAIDGYKIRFRLPVRNSSRWYKATDIRLKYSNFSSWCDYLEKHPEYKNYPY